MFLRLFQKLEEEWTLPDSFILWSQYYPDTKAICRHHKKRKLQTNILYESIFQHTIGGKKNTSFDALERVRETLWLNLHHPYPKAAELRFKRDFPGWWLPLWEKVRACEWTPGFSNCIRSPFLSCLNQSIESWSAWPRGRKSLGKQQIGLSEGIKGMRILLTTLQAPPTSHWGSLTCGSSQLAHGHSHRSTCLIHTCFHPVASSLCMLPVAVSGFWQMASKHV